MKLKKLNSQGFSHDVIAILFVAVFAIGGVGYLVGTHADQKPKTAATTAHGSIGVDAYYVSNTAGINTLLNSNAYVYVSGRAGESSALSCNGVPVYIGRNTNFGETRTLNCSPGPYQLNLTSAKTITGFLNGKGGKITASAYSDPTVSNGSSITIKLGTGQNH
jgi:hypothetical protein